jgi:hypothetical protein
MEATRMEAEKMDVKVVKATKAKTMDAAQVAKTEAGMDGMKRAMHSADMAHTMEHGDAKMI